MAILRWSRDVRRAFAVAIAADAVQFLGVPLFAPGVLSPLNDVLDLVVAGLMIRLLGWHWAFLPAFVAELIPFGSLVPTWTMAVWIATRGRRAEAGPLAAAPVVAHDPVRPRLLGEGEVTPQAEGAGK